MRRRGQEDVEDMSHMGLYREECGLRARVFVNMAMCKHSSSFLWVVSVKPAMRCVCIMKPLLVTPTSRSVSDWKLWFDWLAACLHNPTFPCGHASRIVLVSNW